MNKKSIKILVVVLFAILVGLLFAFDLNQYLTLEYLKESRNAFANYYNSNRIITIGTYFLIYIVVTALSLPGVMILTLAGGALFGFVTGFITISFASTIGATCAFIVARFVLRGTVQEKFGEKLAAINRGIKKDGPFCLFTLRLVPLFPFFVINLVMGLTPISTLKFYIVSQIGMLPGTQLAQIDFLKGLVSPGIIMVFVLLGFFPLIAKKSVSFYKNRKIMSRYKKPKNSIITWW